MRGMCVRQHNVTTFFRPRTTALLPDRASGAHAGRVELSGVHRIQQMAGALSGAGRGLFLGGRRRGVLLAGRRIVAKFLGLEQLQLQPAVEVEEVGRLRQLGRRSGGGQRGEDGQEQG